MCDDFTENDIDKFVAEGGPLNRRDFGKLSAAVGFAALLPSVANAQVVTEVDLKCGINLARYIRFAPSISSYG